MSNRQKAASVRDRLAISVRAFVPPPKTKTFPRNKLSQGPSEWTLVFDTETTTDARQALRFGTYQVRRRDQLVEAGIFFSGEELNKSEQAIIRRCASSHGLRLMTKEEFVEEVFYGIGYDLRATIVGFNLPFDLSRLAIRHGVARGKTMRGGFTLQLSRFRWRPHIQMRHLNARASLIQFTKPWKRHDTRGMRKRGIKVTPRRGPFIDVKTLAAALFSKSFSLGALSEFLKTENRKGVTDEHGGPLTTAYVAYAVQDVQVTWECYRALVSRFENHRLTQTRVSQILSEASLGKAYLREMGGRPWRELQPDFPDRLIGFTMSTYFGGRSEVHLRRTVTQVLYCDFLSMYPTVCVLMGLWQFVIAGGVTWRENTAEVKAFLERVTLNDLQRPETWRLLNTVVQILPGGDILPVRAKYDGVQETIGLNVFTSEAPCLYTLADCVASKLLTGKAPTVLRAIGFEPKEPQGGLNEVMAAGNPDYRIDPNRDDFFQRLIDLRQATKAKLRMADPAEKPRLDAEQQALKILANATSYGIFVEFIVEELDPPEQRMCFGPSGEPFLTPASKSEQPGAYFHPLLATLITGASRLMLAITEALACRDGLDWVFCDTDSMALAKPELMDSKVFIEKARSVCDWFVPLNPYEAKGSILKIEDANYDIETGASPKNLMPLYCFAISAKRYVLFNLDADGRPIIRKASAHGLGHLLPPYDADDAPTSIPEPSVSLAEMGVERWQYDFWYQIVCAALDGHPDQIDLSYHPALDHPAASRYAATTPRLLSWFKNHNENRSYDDQVRPFNFMLAFQALPNTEPDHSNGSDRKFRRTKGVVRPKPIAPYNTDTKKAAERCFDRETGEPINPSQLMTYRQALAQYHLHPESKFLNGDYLDRGATMRRHVQAIAINHIGKEANHWEEQFYLGFEDEEQIEYGIKPEDAAHVRGILKIMGDQIGRRALAHSIGISRTTLDKFFRGSIPTPATMKKIARTLTCFR